MPTSQRMRFARRHPINSLSNAYSTRQSAALLAAIKEYEASKWKVIGQKVGKPAKVGSQIRFVGHFNAFRRASNMQRSISAVGYELISPKIDLVGILRFSDAKPLLRFFLVFLDVMHLRLGFFRFRGEHNSLT